MSAKLILQNLMMCLLLDLTVLFQISTKLERFKTKGEETLMDLSMIKSVLGSGLENE